MNVSILIGIYESNDLDENRVRLAKIMAKRYFCNISDCLKLMINPETSSRKEEKRLKDKKIKVISFEDEVFNYIHLTKAFDVNFDSTNQKEYVESMKNIKNTVEFQKYKLTEKQILAIILLRNMQLNLSNENDGNNLNCEIKYSEYKEKYPFGEGIITGLVKKGIVKKEENDAEYNDFEFNINQNEESLENDLVLNQEQKKVYDDIAFDIDFSAFSENLIYGVTGSGKTEIYIQLIKRVLKEGKNAIVLVPEISLTPQMVERFTKRFKENICILHSKLGSRRRYEEWKRISSGEARIVIGARSAIFSPLKNIGIIIVDEEHDGSYRSETTPKYDAKEIAKYIAKINDAVLIYGTATPLIETYYRAKNGEINLHKLTKRINDLSMPKTEIIDLKLEKEMLSKKLISEIQNKADKGEQSILFLNRRGHSSVFMCKECGNVKKCKRCNVSLTYHKKEQTLKCHYCGYKENVNYTCDKCFGNMEFLGLGTEKVQNMLEENNITALRMDVDTTSKEGHEEILNKFNNPSNNINALVGTQMITKGHHFSKVTLSSVVFADSMINMESYRASEIAFQNIVQVIGRSGREENGIGIIQTYDPENHILNLAKENDYETFYNYEIMYRKMMKYPPFNDILQFKITSKYEKNAIEISKMVKLNLEKLKEQLILKQKKNLEKEKNDNIRREIEKEIINLEEMEILEASSFKIDKIINQYRWRVIVKVKLTSYLANGINFILQNINDGIKRKANISVDVNPFNI